MTRLIRITECSECPYLDDVSRVGSYWGCFCGLNSSRKCPPTGTPDWCPLEKLSESTEVRR